MISLSNILTIAKFESKVIWRNWFFRIFSVGILFFLSMFNTFAFSLADDSPRWFNISNSWGIPYGNMFLLSIAQAAAIIFLASGLIKKDKKIDTNEVFFTRSISNADYVFGKALALFKLFFWLNVVILSIGLIVNLTNPNAAFNPMGYIIYPLLSSLPSIVFTTGLAFLLVTLLRNQPVTIVLLLGFSGVILIYLFGKFANIFDYMAFRFAMLASEISGFSDLRFILLQRSFYFTAGITFLFATSLFLDRLSNHQRIKYAVGFVTFILAGLSTYLMLTLWNTRQDKISLRGDMIALNGEWANASALDILSNHIELEHLQDEIIVTSNLVAQNNSNSLLSTIYFTLNPGLEVVEFSINDEGAVFERDLHIISSKQKVEPGESVRVKITYQGGIREEVAHLEVKQERYEIVEESFYPVQRRYGFLQSDYALLTNDLMWYPETQIGYSRESPIKEMEMFTEFSMDVKVNENLIPVSQGAREQKDNNYTFRPEFPLPQISLAIGRYEKKELTVDSVDYVVYHYPKSDYFVQHFDLLGDTLSTLITDLVTGYQHDQKIEYPFRRLQLVETPIQFMAFSKIYQSHQAYVQPETVYFPEKGGDSREFDLARQHRNMDRQSKEENQVLSDKEKQANVFTNMVKKVFTKQKSSGRFFFDGRDVDDENYSIFPNLYTYNTGIVSDDMVLLNKSISSYLNSDNLSVRDFSRNINGISFTEECNQLMGTSTLMEILTQEEEFNKIQKSVSLKGEYLFSYLDQIVGAETFKSFLRSWINEHQHQLTNYQDFSRAISAAFNIDIDPIIRQVYSETNQPTFLISNTEEYEILDGDRKRYQVLVDVTNTGDNHGVIKVSFDTGSDAESGFFRQRDEDEKPVDPGHLAVVRMGETKQLGFVLDEKPGQISINTLVSRNIPSVINLATNRFDVREKAKPFEGERLVERKEDSQQYEVIVDNEDPGFSTFSPIKATYLRDFLDKRNPTDKKYYGVWRRSYSKWLATTGSDFYGQYVRSAHFTRAGKGEKITEWTPELKESGFYDLYVFMMGNNQNSSSRSNKTYTYQYLINHGDGKDEINYNVSNAERGWNYLGSYYFEETGGSVVLTDKCDLRSVYADAIKWVKQ